jgi:IS605 OrfB family transposase
VTDHDTIVVEQLNVAGMLRNRSLARHIADAGWGELRRQLTYRTAWAGRRLVQADPFYPQDLLGLRDSESQAAPVSLSVPLRCLWASLRP